MFQSNKIKYLAIILLVAFLSLLLWFSYSYGKSVVQKDWDIDKVNRDKAIAAVESQYAAGRALHNDITGKLKNELAATQSKAKTDLAAVHAEYAKRLLTSQTREGIYKRQAEGGTLECRVLADTATKLDASLERGRYLVQQLRTTLGQREVELRIVGSQLLADRKLFESEN